MLEKMDDLTSCSLSYVASILGGKWKPFIVWYLSMAPGKRARYSELRKRIPYDISHKMFSQHLSELEQVGIIERVVVEVKPLRVDYLLTRKGISFANVLYFIRDWGAAYGGFSAETLLRTKGTMGDGVLVYGDVGDESGQGAGGGSILPGNSTPLRSTCAVPRAKTTRVKTMRAMMTRAKVPRAKTKTTCAKAMYTKERARGVTPAFNRLHSRG